MKAIVVIVRRIFYAIVTILLVTVLLFVITRLLPEDPIVAWCGGGVVLPGYRETLVEMFHLDKSIIEQYAFFLYDTFIRFDFGISPITKKSINADLLRYLPNTIELAVTTMLIAIVGGVLGGIVSAVYQYKLPDHLVRLISVGGNCMPVFWAGLVAQIIFYVNLGWVSEPGGLYSRSLVYQISEMNRVTGFLFVDSLIAGNLTVFMDHLSHLFLPSLVQSFWITAIISRITRSAMLDVLPKDFIRTFRAFGLSEKIVILRHALRNASIPVVTTFGWTFGSILAGSAVVETVFFWPGIGLYLYNGMVKLDFPVIAATTLVITIMFVAVNTFCDILYSIMDPRIRLR